jgi:microcystin-dependent protein
MAYDATKPEDTGFLSEAPNELRNNFKGLKEDQIVDAALLKGLVPGNGNGQIPVNNGTECENLNAAMLSGKTPNDFAPKVHTHNTVTASSDGFMTAVQNNKLAGIAANAEVNQVAFSNVLVGTTTIQADSKTDTLELVAGANIAITPDALNDRLTIASKDTTYNVVSTTSSGLAPICDGSTTKFLRADATWSVPTYNVVSTTSAGLAPICDGSTTKFLRADATWSVPIPIGLIAMWSGSIASIPTGWNLCDGSNSTPDLRNRFIVGAGSSYVVGATGGEATHVLTPSEMPVHAHAATAWTDTQGAHAHSIDTMRTPSEGSTGARVSNTPRDTGYVAIATGVAGAHGHNVGVSIQNNGGGAAHNNLPPYYALAYIMRIA